MNTEKIPKKVNIITKKKTEVNVITKKKSEVNVITDKMPEKDNVKDDELSPSFTIDKPSLINTSVISDSNFSMRHYSCLNSTLD